MGTFGPGKMVPQFDEVLFDDNTQVGKVYGPVKTVFGHHLILLKDKFDEKERA